MKRNPDLKKGGQAERNLGLPCFIKITFSILLNCSFLFSIACNCPPTELSLKECAKYEIIFKGTIISVKNCDQKFGEAIFEVEELYKGNVTKQFKVLFDCKVECAQTFSPGEEWLIYTNYKQIDNAKMDWCSRSRKYFKVEQLDFYKVNYGVDYYDEEKFLSDNLGLHRFLKETNTQEQNRNIRPDSTQILFILLASIAAMVLFYWLFNRFFR